jgi:ABC-type taurine transport system substrate-binding protein
MATLIQIQEFALGNPALKQRFQSGRIQAAWDILAEPNGGTAPRAAWRMKIFNDTNADLDREYVWFLSHANIQSAGNAITDAALVTAVKSFIDAWAAIT